MAALTLLPEDIMRTQILARLPVKSVIRFSSVCKSWKSLFSEASFIKDHLKRTAQNPDEYKLVINKHVDDDSGTKGLNYFEIDILSLSNLSETKIFDVVLSEHEYAYAPVQLVGSINGLVCLYFYKRYFHEFRLWNPAIRRAKMIETPFKSGYPVDLCGFCWDEVENDFKVVVYKYLYEGSASLYVYSCNSDSWTLQPRIPSNYDFKTSRPMAYPRRLPSVIVNGEPYWQYFELKKHGIFKFDVRSKEFRMMPVLDVEVSGRHSFLFNWKECLSALVTTDFNWHTGVNVYCFDEICGVWSKMHSIEPNAGIVNRLVGCFTYGGEIISGTYGNYMCFDHKTKKVKGLGIREGEIVTCSAYQASLLVLEGMKKLHHVSPIQFQ